MRSKTLSQNSGRVSSAQLVEGQDYVSFHEEQGYQICELQAKTSAYIGKTGYYSILAYANVLGMKIKRERAIALGKKATAISNQQNCLASFFYESEN